MNKNVITPLLSEQQYSVLNDYTSRETFFIGGVGSGKTYVLGLKAYFALLHPGSVIGIYAPTKGQLNTSTQRQIIKCWNSINFLNNIDYVLNVNPPEQWKISKFSGVNSTNILTTRWGSYAVFNGLENYDTQRGQEFDEIFVDEFRDIDLQARDVLLGRLRGNVYNKLNKVRKITYATTPPDDVSFLLGLYESKDENISFVFAPTHSNTRNVGVDYIKSMSDSYDDIKYRREVLGELVVNDSVKFMWAFSYAKHVGSVKYNPLQPVYLSFDFNVSPMTCIAAQHYNDNGIQRINIISEFIQHNSDVYKFSEYIKSKLPENNIVFVTGDSSGNNRGVLGKQGITAYNIIQTVLNIPSERFIVPKSNLHHTDSRILCNSILDKHKSITIDSTCKNLIKDMDTCNIDRQGKIDKTDLSKTHLLDCIRYYLHNFHFAFSHKK